MSDEYVFDLEANGLLYEATKIHCICLIDLVTEEEYSYTPDTLKEGLDRLHSAKFLVCHNMLGYDLPLIKKLCPAFEYPEQYHDTFIISSLLEPDRPGGHGLAQYGIEQGRPKPEHEDWSVFTPEMMHRCIEDTWINLGVWRKFEPKIKEDF